MGKIFLTGVGAPAAKPGVTSWNDLEDKPFGEIAVEGGGDTITWDGVVGPEDPSVTNQGRGVYFKKVSDSTPSYKELTEKELVANVYIEDSSGEGGTLTETIPPEQIYWQGDNVCISEIGFVIYEDNSVLDLSGGIPVTFPTKGVYLFKAVGVAEDIACLYTTSFTIKGYDFATYETKTLDPKYVSGIGQSNLSPEFQEFLKNLKPSTSYNDLTNKPSIVLSVDDSGVLSLRVIHTEGTEPVEDFASYEKAESEDGEEIVGMTMNSTYGANQINDKTLEVN